MLKFKDLMKRINETRSLYLEEVEQVDELSMKTMASDTKKASADFADRKPKMMYDGQLKKMQNRKVGAGRAMTKMYGEDAGQTDEALKGDQHKLDANKNGKVDGQDFKILRNAKKARYQ